MAVSVPTLVPPDDAAKLLGDLSPSTLAAWRVNGGGPAFIRLGARVFYPLDELQAWLASRPRLTSTSELTEASRRPNAGRRRSGAG